MWRTGSDYEKYLKYVKVAQSTVQMPNDLSQRDQSITLYSDNIEVPHGDAAFFQCRKRRINSGIYALNGEH